MIGTHEIAADWLADASSAWLMVLLDAALKGLIVLLVAAIATRWMRHASAATRHLVWLLAALGLFAMPVLSVTLPAWNVLPSWMGWPAADARVAVVRDDPLPHPSPNPAVDLEVVHSEIPSSWEGPPRPESRPDAHTAAVFTPPVEQSEGPFLEEHDEERVQSHYSAAMAAEPGAELPATVSQPAPNGPIPWQAWVLSAWAVGAVVGILPIVLGGLSLWRLKRSAMVASDVRLTNAFRQVSKELGIRRQVRLLLSDHRFVPMQWGTWRPILLLPDGAQRWSSERLRAVFLHELSHVRRNDCLARILVHVLCAKLKRGRS